MSDQEEPKPDRKQKAKDAAKEVGSFAAGMIPLGGAAAKGAGAAAKGAAGAAAKGAAGAAAKNAASGAVGKTAADQAKGVAKDQLGKLGGEAKKSAKDLLTSPAKGERPASGRAAQENPSGDAGGDVIAGAEKKIADAKKDAAELGKETAKGAAQGAVQGAKGGWVGAAVGAGLGGAAGALKSKVGRNILIAAIVVLMLPGLLLGGMLALGAISISSMNNQQDEDSAIAAASSGVDESAIRAAASMSGKAPWQLWLWMQENREEITYSQLDSALSNSFSAQEPTLLSGVIFDAALPGLKLGESDSDKKLQEENERMVVEALMSLNDAAADPNSSAAPESTATATATPSATPTVAPTSTFNRDEHSISADDSIWRVVNKDRKLDASYVPAGMRAVNIPYTNPPQLRDEAATAVEAMFAAAAADGVNLISTSTYRSFDEQVGLYGDGSDPTTAAPGTSEHQTGLTLDIGSTTNDACSFEACMKDTVEGTWLRENAHKHGFTLRYPEGKQSITGIPFEPWHFRYVGNTLATELGKTAGLTLEEFFKDNPTSNSGTGANAPETGFTEASAKEAFQTARSWAIGESMTCGTDGTSKPTQNADGTAADGVDVEGVSWDAEQMSNAQDVIGATKGYFEGQPAGTIQRAAVIALATAMQESTLRNIGYGDWETSGVTNPNGTPTTSIGLFQQQDHWGSRDQRLTPSWTTAKFLSVLATVPGWEAMELGDAAMAVQVFADGYEPKYTAWEPTATKMWDMLAARTPAIPKPADLAGPGENVGGGGTANGAKGGAQANMGCNQPVTGTITGAVGLPIDPSSGASFTDFYGPRVSSGSSFHQGIDIGIGEGTPIYAIADGEVIESAYFAQCAGNSVGIYHESADMTSTYWHQAVASPLKVGDKVKAGQQIGVVGNTVAQVCSFGNHLHMNIHQGRDTNGNRINPIPVMKGWGIPICEAYPISGDSSRQTCD